MTPIKVGLLGIGIALTLGIGMRIGAAAGALLYLFMYAASLPLENNPVIDDHLLGAISVVVPEGHGSVAGALRARREGARLAIRVVHRQPGPVGWSEDPRQRVEKSILNHHLNPADLNPRPA